MPGRRGLVIALLAALFASSALAEPWPGDAGAQIGDTLPAGFEPSGAVWHSARGSWFVVGDGGELVELELDGEVRNAWKPGGDLEGVTRVGELLYLAREHPDAVLAFDPQRGELTGEEWDLTPFLRSEPNRGLEALTYVDGVFYAGLQGDGRIYRFRLDREGQVRAPGSSPGARDVDISGLHYEPSTGMLYAIYDEANLLVELDVDARVLREFDLPGDGQEALALYTRCPWGTASLLVGGDATGELWRYAFPVTCKNAWMLWAGAGFALACLVFGVNWIVRRRTR